MTKQLTYKGYTATVEFDAEDRLFFGRLSGISDMVTFHSESAVELVEAFEQAVEGYLAMSEQLGRAPQSPHVRRIIVRVPTEVHARAAALAQVEGKSLDTWAQEVLVRAASRPSPIAATH
ncbi:MAG: type II toxin-antitoxin system HicB family antitoxin [Anaerolineae bacterium]|jgi:predicted HicB family RNase H-like nuclease